MEQAAKRNTLPPEKNWHTVTLRMWADFSNSSLLFASVTSRATEMMRSDTFLPLFFNDSVKKDGLFSFWAEMS